MEFTVVCIDHEAAHSGMKAMHHGPMILAIWNEEIL